MGTRLAKLGLSQLSYPKQYRHKLKGGFNDSMRMGDLGTFDKVILRWNKLCNMKMNFICSDGPRSGNFCTAARTHFRVQKLIIPFCLIILTLYLKTFLARRKDTFSLGGGFNNAWLKSKKLGTI